MREGVKNDGKNHLRDFGKRPLPPKAQRLRERYNREKEGGGIKTWEYVPENHAIIENLPDDRINYYCCDKTFEMNQIAKKLQKQDVKIKRLQELFKRLNEILDARDNGIIERSKEIERLKEENRIIRKLTDVLTKITQQLMPMPQDTIIDIGVGADYNDIPMFEAKIDGCINKLTTLLKEEKCGK